MTIAAQEKVKITKEELDELIELSGLSCLINVTPK